MSEYAPPPPKVRVTKAQLRKQQEAYRLAEQLAEDHSKEEEDEKKKDVEILEKKNRWCILGIIYFYIYLIIPDSTSKP